jgi:hypothetical protein
LSSDFPLKDLTGLFQTILGESTSEVVKEECINSFAPLLHILPKEILSELYLFALNASRTIDTKRYGRR